MKYDTSLDQWLQTFRRNVVPSSSKVTLCAGIPCMKEVRNTVAPTQRQTPEHVTFRNASVRNLEYLLVFKFPDVGKTEVVSKLV